MKKIFPFLIFFIFLNASAFAEESLSTLKECYELALKQSEVVAISREKIKEAEGRFTQSLSTVLPNVSFAASEKRQSGSGSSSFTLKEIPETKFVFTQPLFSGFKEFAAMSGSRAERRQVGFEERHAEITLFVDVSDAFYLLQEKEDDLNTFKTVQETLSQRMAELNRRESLGRSRLSEVKNAEAQLRRVEAQLEDAKAQEIVARQLLEFLTGKENIEIASEEGISNPPLEDVSQYIGKVELRPDVKAAKEALIVAQKEVTVAKSGYWPEVSAQGNYYTKRVGVSEDVDWDATVVATVPIFDGMLTAGKVKEAKARSNEANLQVGNAKRRALLEIKDNYAQAKFFQNKSNAYQKALEAAEENYKLQAKDYENNLVNNLDVLTVLQNFQDARRDYTRSFFDSKRAYWRLKTATGETL